VGKAGMRVRLRSPVCCGSFTLSLRIHQVVNDKSCCVSSFVNFYSGDTTVLEEELWTSSWWDLVLASTVVNFVMLDKLP
jgi:hypothetical protein